jgi:prevent-host-death family protein
MAASPGAALPHSAFVEHVDLVVVHGPSYQAARACDDVPREHSPDCLASFSYALRHSAHATHGRHTLARRLIARCSNRCYIVPMSTQPEITQRDLRMRSKEIMDAVERGQAFTVTRDGHSIGELVPLRQRRRFVSRAEFAAMSRAAPVIDAEAFRADQDAAADQAGSAYER